MILKNLLKLGPAPTDEDKRTAIMKNLLRRSAKVGGTVFGPIPKGHRREFFCLDKHTWVWHEEWLDESGQRRTRTTRYDVRPTGILKAQDDSGYHMVSVEEADRLLAAAEAYEKRVRQEILEPVA